MNDHRLWLEHVRGCVLRIHSHLGSEPQRFYHDLLVQDAVLRNLQMLAQSALRLPDEVQLRHPEVNWRGIRSFRNIIVHEYLGLDIALTWKIIEDDLPLLQEAVDAELKLLRPLG